MNLATDAPAGSRALRIAPSPSVEVIEFEGRLLLFDRARGALHVQNEAASRLWERMTAGAAPFDAPDEPGHGPQPSQSPDEIATIVRQWRRSGLLAAGGRDAPPPRASSPARLAAGDPPNGWSRQWTCELGGRRIRFAVEHPVGAMLIHTLFGRSGDAEGPAEALFEVRDTGPREAMLLVDGTEVLRTRDSGLLLGAIHTALLERLHGVSRWRALIHGGAAAFRGGCVGFPGPSGSGKTTLVATLIGQGWTYVSDDLLAISAADEKVVPWPVPLSIKSGSWDVVAERHPDLWSRAEYRTKGLRARLLEPPAGAWRLPHLPLRALVFPSYRPGADPGIEEIEPFEAVVALLSDRAWLGCPLARRAIEEFLAWIRRVPCLRLVHGDAERAADALTRIAR